MASRGAIRAALAALLVLLSVGLPAQATVLPERTLRASVAPDGRPADGGSAEPVLSASGRVIAYTTTATSIVPDDANGPVADVVAVDLATDERRLVTAGADGPSSAPSMSADGQLLAFQSAATNLVAGDGNGTVDVLARRGRDPVVLVSARPDGAPGSGASLEPDVAAAGRFVAFTSTAPDLVPGDTNGVADVFVRDLVTGTTRRVSVPRGGGQANAASGAPAISADGRHVAFSSRATNLVARDRNRVADVFVRDLVAGRTERVSVSSAEREQDRAVAAPFAQMPDISADGRHVVFDSDARTLTRGDRNRRTDVFLRDRRRGTTKLVSASSVDVQGDNDSFAPRISSNGRLLTFQSFATNLAAGGGPREDIFLRDLRDGITTVVNVTADGRPRSGELVPQLLQRPALSDDGTLAAFSSTVPDLVAGDGDPRQDIFLRQLDAPTGRIVHAPRPGRRGTVVIAADDPQARVFTCQVDDGDRFLCGRRIPVKPGFGRVLKIRVGGAGMRSAPEVLRVRLTPRR